MKTTMRILSWILVLGLALAWMNTSAENTDPTQQVCVGDQPYHVEPVAGVTYNWSISGGTAGVNWQLPPTGANITVNWLLPGVYILSVQSEQDGCLGPIQSVEVTVIAGPVGPTLATMTPPDPSICEGQEVMATFNPGSGGIGCSDEFEYSYDNDGNWLPYTGGTLIPTTGHTQVEIRGRRAGCDATLGCGDTPWEILASWTVTAAPPVAITIEADPNPICAGQSITFTATVENGGSTPTFVWYKNGEEVPGVTTATYTYVPADGDVVYCIVTSSLTCASNNPATSTTVTVIVKPVPTTPLIWHN